jgi:hypothetical protein
MVYLVNVRDGEDFFLAGSKFTGDEKLKKEYLERGIIGDEPKGDEPSIGAKDEGKTSKKS